MIYLYFLLYNNDMDSEFLTKLFIYITTILGVLFFNAGIQLKEKKNILLTQSIGSFFYMISYILVGAASGYLTDLVQITKGLSFYHYEKDNRNIPLWLVFLLTGVLIIIGVITYNGIYSLCPLIINLAYIISAYFKNPKYIRLTILVCAIIWCYYNYTVGTYVIILGNILEIVSAVTSLIKYKKEVN